MAHEIDDLDEPTVVDSMRQVPRRIDATDLARELAVFADPHLPKGSIPPDLRRQPLLHYRYQRLCALMRAFDFDDLSELLEGRFVGNRPIEDYAPIVERIRDHLGNPNAEINLWQLEFLFLDLLQFRAEASIAPCSEGAVELDYAYGHFARALSSEVVRPVREKLAAIDEVLAAILDPRGRSYTEEELSERFQSPGADLGALTEPL